MFFFVFKKLSSNYVLRNHDWNPLLPESIFDTSSLNIERCYCIVIFTLIMRIGVINAREGILLKVKWMYEGLRLRVQLRLERVSDFSESTGILQLRFPIQTQAWENVQLVPFNDEHMIFLPSRKCTDQQNYLLGKKVFRRRQLVHALKIRKG